MNRRLVQLRAGPASATLLRRIGGARPGTLALLVEVWGVDEPRHRAAIEQRLAAGMAGMFERRDGSLTARLKLALIAGDRWLRRVIDQEAGAAPQQRLLGAGASLLYISEEEAFLAQAGPAVAYRLDLGAPEPGTAAPSGDPELARHPTVSPWLRRGVDALSDDALWPPLGMSRSGSLEVHFSHWSFPPGAAAILAPSTAAELLSREVVRDLLRSDPAGLQRRLDDLLPSDLPLVCLAQPRPPSLEATIAPPDAVEASGAEPPIEAEEARYDEDRLDDDGAPSGGPRPPERWVRWIGPPEPEPPGSGASTVPDLDLGRTTRFDAIAFDTGLLDLGEPAAREPSPSAVGQAALPASGPGRPTASSGASPTAARSAGAASPRTGRGSSDRLARLAARVLLGLLPRRDGQDGEDGYTLERARLGAALAMALPTAALLLTMLMRLNGLGGADGAALPEAPASAVTDAAGILRLADLRPVADLDGEADDPRQLLVNGNTAYILNGALQRVDWVNVETQEVHPALQRGQAVGQAPPVGLIEDLALVPPPTTGPDSVKPAEVIALDAADRLWWLRPELVEPLERPAEPAWTRVDQLAGFDGRLYVLDRALGQIVRYSAIGGSFPRYSLAGEAWLKTPERLENAAQMRIDGAVYIRLVDGSLRRFVGGAPAPFAISGLPAGEQPPPLTAIAMGAGEAILAADRAGGRILALGPEGAWRATILRPAQSLESNPDGRFGALTDLAWDGATGRLYILDGRTLLVASLPTLP